MTDSLTVYGAISSRARRVLWTLEELELPYTFVPVNLRSGEHRTPEYLAMNPNGRVPTLVDGHLVLFESAAIALHLATKAPERGLLPESGTADSALHSQWMFWICTELEQALWSMGKHRFALPASYRIPRMMETAEFEWARAAPILAAALDGKEFLVGDRFTVADIFAAHTLNWGRGFKAAFGSEILENYLDRMLSRPAFGRTNSPPVR